MRIQTSEIKLSSRHEQDYKHSIETHGSTTFRAVLGEASATGQSEADSRHERLTRMLQTLVDAILSRIDGKKYRTVLADAADTAGLATGKEAGKEAGPPAGPQTDGKKVEPGQVARLFVGEREMSWHWEATETISEHERTEVEGCGTIKTKDGQKIAFDLKLDLCRDYNCERSYEQSGSVILHDPLVINYCGKSAELTDERIDFDLDADGKAERLPGLASGSGYLVLDRNHDGRAGDGSELFGARSGDGFADLAKLDADHNGWIDEADPAFEQLRLWMGGKGNGELATLADAGIGAIWLGSTSSQFSLKDSANQLLGEIRATGIYLSEDGRAGSVQQIDLAEQDRDEVAQKEGKKEGDRESAHGADKANKASA